MNYDNSKKAIISKIWKVFGYVIGIYVILVFASLNVGLDSLSYFETTEAKDLRKYSIVPLLCWVVIISLLRFKRQITSSKTYVRCTHSDAQTARARFKGVILHKDD